MKIVYWLLGILAALIVLVSIFGAIDDLQRRKACIDALGSEKATPEEVERCDELIER